MFQMGGATYTQSHSYELANNRYKMPVSETNKLGCYLIAILSSIYGLNAADNLRCKGELIVDLRTHSRDRKFVLTNWSPWPLKL